jgi:hypothetical protein
MDTVKNKIDSFYAEITYLENFKASHRFNQAYIVIFCANMIYSNAHKH